MGAVHGGGTMNPRLKKLIEQLGEAIHESVVESEQIAGVVQSIRHQGFDVMLVLEATIGLNDVNDSDEAADKRGQRLLSPGSPVLKDGSDRELSADGAPFSSHDVNFLKSLRISVEGEA
jgi:hypothetical protein